VHLCPRHLLVVFIINLRLINFCSFTYYWKSPMNLNSNRLLIGHF